MILTLAISGYRSLRELIVPLSQVTVVTGANGSGKSSLYRALRLLGDVAQGRTIGSLAAEGGLTSTLWAGPEQFSRGMKTGDVAITGTVRKKPIELKLGFASEDYGYAVDLGLPGGGSAFLNDPEIKTESVWIGETLRRNNVIAERSGPSVRVRADTGDWAQLSTSLPPFDSMMTHAASPREAFELLYLRDRMRNWRFYDQLRTDRDAPARRPRVGTRTPVLAGDGGDLAAAVLTIRDIGDPVGFDETIDDAFPASRVEVLSHEGTFSLQMRQNGLLRPLNAAELSDGTLRYILLTAALMTPRPPSLMVLNEPETSLHPDLIPPLARLITKASENSQIIVVSHSAVLARELENIGASTLNLVKDTGETTVPEVEIQSWSWMKR